MCHIAGWLFLVDRVYVTGHSVGVLLEPGHSPGFWAALAYAWLGHMASGILMTLVFRHYYFRKAWGNQRPLATLPLALVLALLTGMLQSVLVQWPVDEVTGTSFRVYREGGRVDIACAASGGTLRVEVRNTAAQPDQEAGQRQLNAAPDATAENGLGLTNIRNRLYLLYGERALMSLSHRGDEFVVVLELPGEHAA